VAPKIGRRTAKSYQRDVEHISRLRIALRTDATLNQEDVTSAVIAIDALERTLYTILRSLPDTE